MPTIEFMPYKAIPTWKVTTPNGTEVFFNKTNGSMFIHPYSRAMQFYNKYLT